MAVTKVVTWNRGLATSGQTLATYYPTITGGKVVWLDSTSTATPDGTEERPYVDLATAHTNVTTATGAAVVIKSTHRETLSSTATLSKSGVTYIGLGSGTNRPTFTCSVAGVGINVTGTSNRLVNLYFPAATGATTFKVSFGGLYNRIDDCTFVQGTSEDVAGAGLRFTTGGGGSMAKGCTFTASGSATTKPYQGLISANSLDGVVLEDCTFDGGSQGWANYALAINATNFRIINCTMTAKSDIEVPTGATGIIIGLTQTGAGSVDWTP